MKWKSADFWLWKQSEIPIYLVTIANNINNLYDNDSCECGVEAVLFKGISWSLVLKVPGLGVLLEEVLGRGVLSVLGLGVLFKLLPGVHVLLDGVWLLTLEFIALMTSTPEKIEVWVKSEP